MIEKLMVKAEDLWVDDYLIGSNVYVTEIHKGFEGIWITTDDSNLVYIPAEGLIYVERNCNE